MTGKYFERIDQSTSGSYLDRLGVEAHVVKRCGDCARFVNPWIERDVTKGFCRVLEKIVWGILTPQHNRDRRNIEITDKCWIKRSSWG